MYFVKMQMDLKNIYLNVKKNLGVVSGIFALQTIEV